MGMDKEAQCPLTKEELLQLVKEEARCRLSQEFLSAVEKEEREGESDGTETIVKMQKEVVAKFGHPEEMVEVLRSARYWYPGVQEFWDVPIQVKENIMRDCTLTLGEKVPNMELLTVEGSKEYLFDTDGTTVLLAGSYS